MMNNPVVRWLTRSLPNLGLLAEVGVVAATVAACACPPTTRSPAKRGASVSSATGPAASSAGPDVADMRLYPVAEGFAGVEVSFVDGAVFVHHTACEPRRRPPKDRIGEELNWLDYTTRRVDRGRFASDSISAVPTPRAFRVRAEGFWPASTLLRTEIVHPCFNADFFRWDTASAQGAWVHLSDALRAPMCRRETGCTPLDAFPSADGNTLVALGFDRCTDTNHQPEYPIFWWYPQQQPFARQSELAALVRPFWEGIYARDKSFVRVWKAHLRGGALVLADGGCSLRTDGDCLLRVITLPKSGPVRVQSLPLPKGTRDLPGSQRLPSVDEPYPGSFHFLPTPDGLVLWVTSDAGSVILRDEGGDWRELPVPAPGVLDSLQVTPSGTLWATMRGTSVTIQSLWRYSHGWREQGLPEGAHTIAGADRGILIALTHRPGHVYRLGQQGWLDIPLQGVAPDDVSFSSVVVASPQDVWVVGSRDKGGAIVLRSIPTTPKLTCTLAFPDSSPAEERQDGGDR